MGNTTISVNTETKRRFDLYFQERKYQAFKEGKSSFRTTEAMEELMDKVGVQKLPEGEKGEPKSKEGHEKSEAEGEGPKEEIPEEAKGGEENENPSE